MKIQVSDDSTLSRKPHPEVPLEQQNEVPDIMKRYIEHLLDCFPVKFIQSMYCVLFSIKPTGDFMLSEAQKFLQRVVY